MSPAVRRRRRAFTVVELLVVIAIAGLLLGILMAAVQRVRESSARSHCLSNLRQMGLALHQYHDLEGVLPPSAVTWTLPQTGSPVQFNWMVLLLPHLDQEPLWSSIRPAYAADPSSYHNPPHTGLATVVPQYVCPTDDRLRFPLTDRDGITASFTSYLAVAGGWGGPYQGTLPPPDQVGAVYDGARLTDIRDGTSNTLMVGERPPPLSLQAGWWYSSLVPSPSVYFAKGPDPDLFAAYGEAAIDDCAGPFKFGPGALNNPCDRWHFWSLHPGGANFLFADGSAKFLSYAAEPVTVALATRSGGENGYMWDY